jgi:hypothetical protein
VLGPLGLTTLIHDLLKVPDEALLDLGRRVNVELDLNAGSGMEHVWTN